MTETSAPAPQSDRSTWQSIKGALRGEQYDYTQGAIGRAILLLAVPMVLEMALESVFALVDIWWVNQIDRGLFSATPTGGAAAAAVGATEALLTIVYAIAIGVGMATTATVARRVGEKDLPGASVAAAQSIGLGLALGVLIGVPCTLFAPELLGMMTDGNQKVVEAGTGYAQWVLGGNVIVTLLFLQNAIFRGAGDPMLALKTLAVANGINLVLDPCLIFGLGPFPALGITGAGVATFIGRSVAVVYQMWLLQRGRGRIHMPRLIRFDAGPMWTLLRLSMGTVGQFLIATSSWIVLMRLVNGFGEAAAAGYTTGIRILMFALLPAWGLSNAAATLVGQNLGAGRPDRAERSVWLTGVYDMVFLGAVTLAMELFPEAIIAVFTDDPEIARYAVSTLRIVAAGYVFFAWGMVTMQAFNGAGDTRTPTWLNFWFFWVLELPLAWLLAHPLELGPSGVFWSVTVAESAFAVAAVLLFRRGRWKSQKV
ncbi:MAG: MATE family efflux transporter [Planctomycetota bacterium]